MLSSNLFYLHLIIKEIKLSVKQALKADVYIDISKDENVVWDMDSLLF